MPVILNCCECGKPKSYKPSAVYQKSYCSNGCYWKAKKKTSLGAANNNYKGRMHITKKCETCGQLYNPHSLTAPSRFCSSRCLGKRPDNPLFNKEVRMRGTATQKANRKKFYCKVCNQEAPYKRKLCSLCFKAQGWRIRNCKKDRNHNEISEYFEQQGFSVVDTHNIHNGFPDIVVSLEWLAICVEIKHGKRPLTPLQKIWHSEWTGLRAVVTTKHEAMRLVQDARQLVELFHAAAKNAGQPIQVRGCQESMYAPQLF